MRREPTSDANRYNEAAARWGQSPEAPTPPPPAKRKKFRVRVEPNRNPPELVRLEDVDTRAKPKPKPAPKRDIYRTRWKDLTPDEMASFRMHPKEKR